MTTVRIGITGPIGCGKSTVAARLAERGAEVIDADHVAHDVLAPGQPAVDEVVERFGAELRRPDGSIDRAALGRIVFADAAALRDLEAIVHPRVRPRILTAISAAEAAGRPAVVIEAIKLIEGGLAGLCDEVWLVTCHPEAQRERLTRRGLEADDAQRRLDAQRDLVSRVEPRATRRIDTSGDKADTRVIVDEAYDDALGHGTRAAPG